MTLQGICKTINTPAHHFSSEGRAEIIRIDEIAQEIVDKLGAVAAQEIVDIVGPGWEFEFFTLIEEYVRKRG